MSRQNKFFNALLPAMLLVALSFSARAEEKILLDGSTGMLPLATALAGAYQEKYPHAQVELGKGLGTGARLRALSEGKIQIALASHGIKTEELQKANLKVIEIAKGAIVFAVNSIVPVTDITESQVCDIYSGTMRSWQPLGGPDESIAVLTRPPTEVDPEVIRTKIACFKNLKEVDTAKVMPKGGDMAKGLAQTPYAIGMTSMTVAEQSSGKIKALRISGLAASPENVRGGYYYLTRDFLFVVKADTTPGVRKFLDFVQSPDGGRVILANGAVPLR